MAKTKTDPLKHHPMRQRGGKLPHERKPGWFLEYLIREGMTEEDYEKNVKIGNGFAKLAEHRGDPIPTSKLTPDQRGWAMYHFAQHFRDPSARWFINPNKPAIPTPAAYRMHRNREYNRDCECPGSKTIEDWGELYDGRILMQCQECGEVLLP